MFKLRSRIIRGNKDGVFEIASNKPPKDLHLLAGRRIYEDLKVRYESQLPFVACTECLLRNGSFQTRANMQGSSDEVFEAVGGIAG